MMNIAICTPELSYNDAASNDVNWMFRVLKESGYNVSIFAEKSNVSFPKVEHIKKINNFIKSSDDMLIYHFTIRWDRMLEIIKKLDCKKVIKNHNITPSEFFYGFYDAAAIDCKVGRQQLGIISEIGADLYLNDSMYSMYEFIGEGADRSKSFVVPPFHHINRLAKKRAVSNLLDKYNDGKTNILMVGRVVPNKGHRDLIDTFAVYNRYYSSKSRLLIVGKIDDKLIGYADYIRKRIKGYGLEEKVILTGEVSDAELKTYYLMARVFLMTSHHEGFCVPLVEAMSMKIPIVSYGSCAISGTVDRAGLVWDRMDPYLMASSINMIVENEDIYYSLGEIGWRRYKSEFTNDVIREKFLKAVGNLL